MKIKLTVVLLSITMLSGCAHFHTDQDLGSAASGRYETVVLFATSDLRGSLLSVEPGRGGSALLESYFKTLRSQLGSRVVWLDAGDLRRKSLEYGFDAGASFEKFIQGSGMAVTLGPTSVPDSSGGHVLLAGELMSSIRAATPAQLSSPGPAVSLVQAGRLRVGVVSAHSARDLAAEAGDARALGAKLVVWLSDLPIRCNPNPGVEHSFLRRPGEPNGFCEGAIHDIIASLPDGTINAVIASGNGKPLERFIYPRYSSNPSAGIPVVTASPFGRDFHVIYLAYDPGSGQAVFARTRIEGPIAVQEGKFHGQEIKPDTATSKLAQPAEDWVSGQEQITLASSPTPLAGASLSENSERESRLGDLIADAIRDRTQSDFAIVPPGLTQYAFGRAELPSGPVSRIALERALPTDSPVIVIPVTGEELKTLVRISENGSRGFAAVSGMKLSLIRADRDAPSTDLDGDRAVSLWERNRVLELSDLNDKPIQAKHTYRLAVPRYLVDGGDDWHWASRHFGLAVRASTQEGTGNDPTVRELLADYLQHTGKKGEMIGSVPERIRFENPPSHGRRHRRARKRTPHRRHSRTT